MQKLITTTHFSNLLISSSMLHYN